MLGKLIKHEFRATGRTMLPLYAILSVLAVIAGLSMRQLEFGETEMPEFVELVLVLLFAAFFVAMITTVVMAFVLMISRFYKNLLGDEGYLMMTLPVGVHGHIWAKLIVSCLWFIATAVLIVVLMVILAMIISGTDIAAVLAQLPSARELFDQFCDYSGYNGLSLAVFAVETIAVVIVGIIYICLRFYAALSVGHSFANHKMLYSVLAFVVMALVLSLLEGAVTIFMGDDFSAGIMLNYRNFAYSLNRLIFMGLLLSVAETIIMYFITVYFLKNKLNLA